MTYMPQPRINSWTSRTGEVVRVPLMASRREHAAWSMPFAAQTGEQTMRQPQDGAEDPRTRLATMLSHQHSDGLHEAEDARLTGGTRSLDRRLLGLNVVQDYLKRGSVSVAAITREIEVA